VTGTPGSHRLPPWVWAVWTVAWLAVQTGLFVRLGVRLGGDSGRYLAGAEALRSWGWPTGMAAGYPGYEFLVALFLGAGLGPAGVVAGQVALSGVAAYALYRVATRLYGRRVGALAALLYAINPVVQSWTFYILTESAFVSLAILSACLWTEAGTLGKRAAAGAVLLLASVIRPNGVVLPLAAGISALWSLRRTPRPALRAALVAAVILVLAARVAMTGEIKRQVSPIEHYVRGTIIWGYPPLTLPLPGPLPPRVAMEPDLGRQIPAVAAAYPAHFLRLASWKIGYEYLQVRPYYSAAHNGFLLATLLPAYALAAWGVTRRADDPPARAFLAAVVVGQTGLIGLTFADWDGRHLLVILPIVLLFAAAGTWDLVDRIAGRTDRSGGSGWRVTVTRILRTPDHPQDGRGSSRLP
jgi:4-amino-4-deoxy-L-arabinose transferase-like glycosyltransferase